MKKNVVGLLFVAVLAGIAFYLFNNQNENSSSSIFEDFSIKDTASVDKIFLADNDGNFSELTRNENNRWTVNGKYPARDKNVQLILRGIHNFEVKSTVPKGAVPDIIKQIASKPIKVEVYQNKSKTPTKIYYFGFATQDHYGNYALLEIPGEGRSEVPYIIKEKGFYGFIRPRLITLEEEWRSPEIFMYPDLEIQSIKMDYPRFPGESFEISWNQENRFDLKDGQGNAVSEFNTLSVKDYLLQYKEMYVETFYSRLTPAQEDSVINQTIPKAIISVTDINGKVTTATIFDKGYIDPNLRNEEYGEFDPERFYVVTDEKEMALGQTLQWDPLLVPLHIFSEEKSGSTLK